MEAAKVGEGEGGSARNDGLGLLLSRPICINLRTDKYPLDILCGSKSMQETLSKN